MTLCAHTKITIHWIWKWHLSCRPSTHTHTHTYIEEKQNLCENIVFPREYFCCFLFCFVWFGFSQNEILLETWNDIEEPTTYFLQFTRKMEWKKNTLEIVANIRLVYNLSLPYPCIRIYMPSGVCIEITSRAKHRIILEIVFEIKENTCLHTLRRLQW